MAGMTDWIGRLWRGEASLGHAFWDCAVLYGTLIHLISTGVAFAAVVAGWPAWIAVAIFLLPTPYTVLCVVAVWRSAERYQGPPKWAAGARIGVVVWALLATAL
jgi:hypothetical protein